LQTRPVQGAMPWLPEAGVGLALLICKSASEANSLLLCCSDKCCNPGIAACGHPLVTLRHRRGKQKPVH
jgi:hypothetical protein